VATNLGLVRIRAASITKTFVAATILQLVAEERVNLDTPIETYLPGRIRSQGIDANAMTPLWPAAGPGFHYGLRRQGGVTAVISRVSQPDGESRC